MAMPIFQIVCPSLHRTDELVRFVDTVPDKYFKKAILKVERKPRALTRIINEIVAESTGDIVFLAADHLVCRPGCFEEVERLFVEHFPDTNGVVGLNVENLQDNPGCNEYAFCAVGRKFIERFKDKKIFCPDYYHFHADTEFGLFAYAMHCFIYAENAKLYSYHPRDGSAAKDGTYCASRQHQKEDDATLKKRRARGLLWGATFERVT